MLELFDEYAVMDDESRKAAIIKAQDLMPDPKHSNIQELDEELNCLKNPYSAIYLASWLFDVTDDKKYIEKLLDVCIESSMNPYEKYFVYSQILRRVFVNYDLEAMEIVKKMDALYDQVFLWYKSQINLPISRIPINERRKDFVLVVTGQLLSIQHGPTKTILDRCKLLKELGKDVLLINLAVMSPFEHIVPLNEISIGSYINEYTNRESIEYEGEEIPYVQFPKGFPTPDQINGLIQLIIDFKPYQIVSVDDSVVIDIINELVPTLVISLTPSELRRTKADYLQIGRPITNDDMIHLKRRGKTEKNVITEVFSSHLAPQTAVKTREELGLPPGVKIAAIIGGRLDTEISSEMMLALKKCMEHGLYLLLLGPTDEIKDMLEGTLGDFFSQVIRPGMVSDTLMYLDHCYVYLNPIRRGGGTSSVEAMSKGVVPVATRYGDVYVNVGEDFAVDDYDEMTKKVIAYLEDEDKWKEMSEKAVKRSEKMLNSEAAFRRVMSEYEKRMLESMEV